MHSMKLFNEPYEQIKIGKKDIELRLFDEKRQLVKIGDLISFKNINTNEEIVAECIELHRAETFQELFQRLNANSRMGFDEGLSPEEKLTIKQADYGRKISEYKRESGQFLSDHRRCGSCDCIQ